MLVYLIILILSSLVIYQIYLYIFPIEPFEDDSPPPDELQLPSVNDLTPDEPSENTDLNTPSELPIPSLSSNMNTNSSTQQGLPIQTLNTIETNMLYLNNHINDLQAKYLMLNTKMDKLQADATKVTEQADIASDLVGDTPLKIEDT